MEKENINKLENKVEGASPLDGIVSCSCGGNAVAAAGALFGYYVECKKCQKRTRCFNSKGHAISSWNFYLYNEGVAGSLIGIALH